MWILPLTLLALALTPGSETEAPPANLVAPADPADEVRELERAAVRFAARATVVREGRGQAIPVLVDPPPAEDVVLATEADDPSVLRVLRPARVLAGESIGYARVRGMGTGTSGLTVEGAADPLRVSVVAPRAEAAVEARRPEIVVPAPDAVVWGEVAVAVETHLGIPGAPPEVVLLLEGPDGAERLAPDGVLPADGGPTERSVFTLDLTRFDAGALELTPEARVGEGPAVRGASVWVTVVHPDERDVFDAECETFRWTERPEPFGAEEPRAGRGGGASGGGFVVNTRPDPIWIVPVEVEEDGAYQAMLVARGDLGAGALPSVGLVVDGPYDPVASTRLADRRWRRVPLGPPFRLAAGAHTLGVRYLNDGPTSQLSDRALYLDRFELLRLDTLAGASADDGAMPMSGDTMSGMSSMSTMSAMSMESMVPDTSPDDAWLAAGPGGLRVAFERAFDDLPLPGRVNLAATCVWNGASNGTAAPEVDLVIDGETVATQQAAEPLFAFDRAALEEGEHAVRLVARLADGRTAETPAQTLRVTERAGPIAPRSEDAAGGAIARAYRRFSVLDERWRARLEPWLVKEGDTPGHRVARLDEGLDVELPLPADLAGTFEVVVQVCGSGQPTGNATLELALVGEAGEKVIGRHTTAGWWTFGDVGTVDLSGDGQRALRVRVVQDEPSTDKDAREPALRSVILRERPSRPDRNPPGAELLYPPPGHVARGVDAVVLHAFDEEDRLAEADVLLDGEERHTFGEIPETAGWVVLPLLLRDVAPGEHRLAVRVTDRAGNLAESREVTIVVEPSDLPGTPPRGPYARAVHLLERFAFGPEPQELARVLVEGEDAWLAARLAERGAGDAAALDLARARLLGPGEYNVRHATLQHLLRTDNPVRARFTLWLENHFSTWMRKASAGPEWREHVALHELGPAPFGELLLASATSPAMLWYLDQSVSFASRLNENYAREIMELHSVGVDGGYDQDEVTALARLLCGLTVAEEAPTSGRGNLLEREFRFAADLADGAPALVLGMRFDRPARDGAYERVLEALELLAAHPSTARHVCRALAEHYVAAPAPDDLVADLVRVFHESGGDLAAVLTAVARHPRFWDAPSRVATPLDYALRLGRALGHPGTVWSLQQFLDRSGMGLYDRATPDGYPEEDDAWIGANATAQRWRLGGEVPWAIRGLVPDALRRVSDGDPLSWRQRVVDVAAVRLTGRTLGEASNAAALDYLDELGGNAWEQADRLAVLLTRLPEASLR